MRTVSEIKEFDKLTKIKDNLFVRVLFDYSRYPLYKEDGAQADNYSELWASLLVLREIYQQGIEAIYSTTGTLPLAGQIIYGYDYPCVIEEVGYIVFLDAVVVNFSCKEDRALDSQ